MVSLFVFHKAGVNGLVVTYETEPPNEAFRVFCDREDLL
jgi:hypothetical protein